MRKPPKLYIIVDSTLSKSQQAVQAAHGAAQYVFDQMFMNQYPSDKWENETLVLLKDRDLEKYEEACDSYWREPDLDDRTTAVSFYTDEFPYDLPLL